ncbi:4Fe-4S dicluster domain-containing protein, partial [Chloroflexota bacterium]
ITFAMDIPPHKLIHLLKYGQLDDVLQSDTIWLCASCETCTTRCPNDIDIALSLTPTIYKVILHIKLI